MISELSSKILGKKNKSGNVFIGFFLVFASLKVNASMDLFSITLDNDVFVGKDNGYTNGLYISLYNMDYRLAPNILVKPLLWSMPVWPINYTIKVNSLGQTLVTAEDITQKNPSEDSIPYSGLLKYTNSYIAVGPNFSDWVSTSIGIVGPAAKGEQTQNDFHKVIGARKAQGWDTQLKNEIVFNISRGHLYRVLAIGSDTIDLLVSSQISLGTIITDIKASATFRLGRNLSNSFASMSMVNSKLSTPIAFNNSWFFYGSWSSNYIYNQVSTDGNTFRNSRSISYNKNFNIFSAGIAYSVGNRGALTFSYNSSYGELDIDKGDPIKKLNDYGSISFSMRF